MERFFARKLPTIMYFSLDVYTRLALPWILPDLKRVVYLDADVLVNTDIAELYDLDLGAHPLAAVGGAAAGAVRYGTGDIIEQLRQGGQPIAKLAGFERYHNYYEYYTQYLHLAPEHLGSTFCSAVMLLDLQRCREPLERQLPQLLGRRFVLPDQDILNIIFQGQAHLLGYEWQTLPDHVLSHVQREGQLPKLIHFVGPKPDVYWGMTPAHVEFWRQLSSTDFFYPALNRFADLRARQLRRDQQRSAQEVQQLRTELKQLRAELAQLRQRPPQARDSVWRS